MRHWEQLARKRLTVREACKGEHTQRKIERGKRLAVHREAYKGKENEMKMKILKKKTKGRQNDSPSTGKSASARPAEVVPSRVK